MSADDSERKRGRRRRVAGQAHPAPAWSGWAPPGRNVGEGPNPPVPATFIKREHSSSGTALDGFREGVAHVPSAGNSPVVDGKEDVGRRNTPKPSSLPPGCHVMSLREPKESTSPSSSVSQGDAQSVAGNESSTSKPSKGHSRFHHHPAVWESHKLEIQQIYMDENKTLKQLIDIMKDRGFKATPRMYKSKFEQWGFIKNNKQKDVATMINLQRQRDAIGKSTTFQRRGRSVDIRTYMRRKGISIEDLEESSLELDLPDYLRAVTPPPDPQHVVLPDHLQAQDVLVACFRDLTLGWRDAAATTEIFEAEFNSYFDGQLCEATRDFGRACWFFSRGHTRHGALLGQRSFSSLHLLVANRSALGLFDLLIASVMSPDYGLLKELWKYLAAYSGATLGPSSTFYRLFKRLEDVFENYGLETSVDFIFNCMDNILAMLLETQDLALTVAPAISFFLLGDLILFNSTRTDLPALQRAVALTLSFVPTDANDSAPDVIRFLEPMLHLWQYGPNDEQSFQLAQASLRQTDEVAQRFDWTYWVSWRVIANYHRSRCLEAAPQTPGTAHQSNPRHALARYSLAQAIDAAEVGRGFREFQIFENLQILEQWHREAGDGHQQLEVHRRMERGLMAYLGQLQGDVGVDPRTPTSQ